MQLPFRPMRSLIRPVWRESPHEPKLSEVTHGAEWAGVRKTVNYYLRIRHTHIQINVSVSELPIVRLE